MLSLNQNGLEESSINTRWLHFQHLCFKIVTTKIYEIQIRFKKQNKSWSIFTQCKPWFGCNRLWRHDLISWHWSKEGLLRVFVDSITSYALNILKDSVVCVVFDRYSDNNIKSATQIQRTGNMKRSHKVAMETTLLTKQI